jgi:hypothetical protein
MRKFAFITAVAAAIGVASMVAIVWSSVSHREDAATAVEVMATKIAEHRHPSGLGNEITDALDRSAPEERQQGPDRAASTSDPGRPEETGSGTGASPAFPTALPPQQASEPSS